MQQCNQNTVKSTATFILVFYYLPFVVFLYLPILFLCPSICFYSPLQETPMTVKLWPSNCSGAGFGPGVPSVSRQPNYFLGSNHWNWFTSEFIWGTTLCFLLLFIFILSYFLGSHLFNLDWVLLSSSVYPPSLSVLNLIFRLQFPYWISGKVGLQLYYSCWLTCSLL